MCKLTIIEAGKCTEVPVEAGAQVAEVLRERVPAFAMPCAGNHTCGKCRVRVRGQVSAVTEAERALLSARELSQGIRLACSCRVLGDASVTLLEEKEGKIVSWYDLPAFEHTEDGYGLAVDIGTTTVAVQLIERRSGRVVAERLAENAQRGFGADVISRIEACKTAGIETLSQRIADQLESMAAACLEESGVTEIQEAVVTGNTTMLHLFEGLDPASLAVSPFAVQSYFGGTSRRKLAGAPVYLPRCIGAYVGADIVCAVLDARLLDGGTQLLTDIGTNGEIVLARDGRCICWATAAGPAFEGAGISCGMPAADGAICRVTYQDQAVGYETIGRKPAAGVCGSGVLDAIAVMLEAGAADESGYLEEPWEIGDSGVFIQQKDIRQIQLAKAAVFAGVKTLLEHERLGTADVERFVIAGGFGNSMNQDSAVAIGLIPEGLRKKTHFIGNGALAGAAMLLMNHSLRRETEAFAQSATEISLSADENFMDHYIDSMSLARGD